MPPLIKPKRATPARKRPTRRGLKGLLLPGLVAVSLVGAIGLLVMAVASYRVAARFEARERESPTRLYGRILALRAGDLMPEADLTSRLRRLGYRKTKSRPTAPGEMMSGGGLTVFLRAFPIPGAETSARVVRVRFDGPHVAEIEEADTGEPLDGVLIEPEVLTTLYGPVQEERTVLPLSEFPQVLRDAVLVAEDRHFYTHPGIDPFGVARAALANFSSGSIKQGGSTLTQQLAKNLYFDQERTVTRKLGEAAVAVILELKYSKDRIFQAYLNEIYLGQRGAVSIRGFAEAAAFYFGEDVRTLDAGQAATLAGLIRAPGLYNPFLHADRALERRNQVLAAMEEDGRISAQESKTAQAAPLKVRKDRKSGAPSRGIAYLADYARQMIGEGSAADLSRAGVRVFTTVDPVLQRRAEETLSKGLEDLERRYRRLRREPDARKLQGALVVLDPRDGGVLAMVGGRDYSTSQFNRITQAHRQPGSLFKPFVYLAGYEQGGARRREGDLFTPATRLMDEPLEMRVAGKTWAPANYDGEFRGEVTAQMALEQSLNVPTVRAAQMIGLDAIVATAARAGIQTPLKPYPSLALGAQEVTPLEIASAYATIAARGMKTNPSLVEAIEDVHGKLTYSRDETSTRALPEQAVYLITVGLQGALDSGTAASARALGFTGTAAGKTGTTDDYRDAWFAGYTPDLVALVWVGFDDGTSTGLTGAQAALPIWVDFMTRTGHNTEDPFIEAKGIVWTSIDPASGGLSRWSCPESRMMAFIEGTEPQEKCDAHGWFSSWRHRRDESDVE